MADVAWICLKVWPWEDEWLEQDTELRESFDEAGFLDSGYRGGSGSAVAGAMNGCADVDTSTGGIQIEGEMRGGSYELRCDLGLLEALRVRGIAYFLHGSAKYEWDADEEWWHPGMRAPFSAMAAEGGGRVLDEHTYRAMRFAAAPASERLEDVGDRLAAAKETLSGYRKSARERGEEHYGIPGQEQAVKNLLRQRDRLVRRPPAAVPIEAQIEAFFAGDPFGWKPGPRYRPKLRRNVEA